AHGLCGRAGIGLQVHGRLCLHCRGRGFPGHPSHDLVQKRKLEAGGSISGFVSLTHRIFYKMDADINGINTLCTHAGELEDTQFKGAVSPLYMGTAYDFEEVDQKRSEEHTSELQSRENLVCRLL